MWSMSDAASSTIDCVARTIAAFFFRQVFSARVIQSRMILFFRKIHASSIRKILKVAVFSRRSISDDACCNT